MKMETRYFGQNTVTFAETGEIYIDKVGHGLGAIIRPGKTIRYLRHVDVIGMDNDTIPADEWKNEVEDVLKCLIRPKWFHDAYTTLGR